MYDYSGCERFKICNVDHEMEFGGIKAYQFPVVGMIFFLGSNIFITLLYVGIGVTVLRAINRSGQKGKHVTLSGPFLKLCWKVKPLQLIFAHTGAMTTTQKRYRT